MHLPDAFYATRKRAAESDDSRYLPTVAVSTQCTDGGVEVRVRDNGTGVPEALAGKIFDPFFTTKPPGEGTGLGLSLSYETVVQQHGGRLVVSSEEGEFTEFVVTLPR
jgi:signal transduction histidine kinase